MNGPGCISVRPFELEDLEAAADFGARARSEDEGVEPFAQRLAIIAEGPRALLPLWRVAVGEDQDVYGISFAAVREARRATEPARAGAGVDFQVEPGQPVGVPEAPRKSIEVYCAVAPALRRQGLARQLFEPLFEWARAEPNVQLRARVRELPGQRFLEAHGFLKGPVQLSLARHGSPPAPRDAPGVTVKPLDRRDQRGLATFKQLSLEAYADAPESFESRADELEQLLSDLGRLLLLGELQGKPAGYLSGVWLGSTLAIEEVAVLPQARRYGVGRALCVEALRRAGTSLLTVAEKNAAARALYKGLGYQQVGRRVIYQWTAAPLEHP